MKPLTDAELHMLVNYLMLQSLFTPHPHDEVYLRAMHAAIDDLNARTAERKEQEHA